MRTVLSMLTLCGLLVGAPSAAQPDIEARDDIRRLGFYAFSVGVGLVNPESGSTSAAVMTRLDIGDLTNRVSVHPALEYWKKTSEALDTRVVNRDLTVAGDVRYTIGDGKAAPYVGAGPALHFVRSEVTSAGAETEDTDTKVGFGVFGGLRFRNLETFSWFAEAKYRWAEDLDSFRAFGGVTLNL